MAIKLEQTSILNCPLAVSAQVPNEIDVIPAAVEKLQTYSDKNIQDLATVWHKFKHDEYQADSSAEYLSRYVAYVLVEEGMQLPFIDEKGKTKLLTVNKVISCKGFFCVILSDSRGHIRVVSRGTDFFDFASIKYNLGQCAGMNAIQHKSTEIIRALSDNLNQMDDSQRCEVTFYGHSQGGSISQLLCAELAHALINPKLSTSQRIGLNKLQQINMRTWNSPAITYKVNDQFRKDMQRVEKRYPDLVYNLSYNKVDADKVQSFGEVFLGYDTQLAQLNIDVKKFTLDLASSKKKAISAHCETVLTTMPQQLIIRDVQERQYRRQKVIAEGNDPNDFGFYLVEVEGFLANAKADVDFALSRTAWHKTNVISKKIFGLLVTMGKDGLSCSLELASLCIDCLENATNKKNTSFMRAANGIAMLVLVNGIFLCTVVGLKLVVTGSAGIAVSEGITRGGDAIAKTARVVLDELKHPLKLTKNISSAVSNIAHATACKIKTLAQSCFACS